MIVNDAVAAAVEAQQGGDLVAVTAAAVSAGEMFAMGDDGDRRAAGATARDVTVVEATARVNHPLGLHARPAALLAWTMAASGARVTVDGVDGASVLALMALGPPAAAS